MVTDRTTDLMGYVNNIPVGDSVVLFTIGNAYYSLWPQEAIAKLSEFGISAEQITTLQDDEPVIIFGRKGDAPGTAVVQVVQPKRSTIFKRWKSTGLLRGGYSTGKHHLQLDWTGY
ncbi:MAG: hypothetical protein QM762_22695 [Chryseolinea sp.]